MKMVIRKRLKVMNAQGLHARPASIFVKIANKYESNVAVTKGDDTVSGKSIMGLMMLAAEQGSEVELEISGTDADMAMRELEAFLSRTDEPKETEGLL